MSFSITSVPQGALRPSLYGIRSHPSSQWQHTPITGVPTVCAYDHMTVVPPEGLPDFWLLQSSHPFFVVFLEL